MSGVKRLWAPDCREDSDRKKFECAASERAIKAFLQGQEENEDDPDGIQRQIIIDDVIRRDRALMILRDRLAQAC